LYLVQAEGLAAELEREGQITFLRDDPELEALKVFYYAHRTWTLLLQVDCRSRSAIMRP